MRLVRVAIVCVLAGAVAAGTEVRAASTTRVSLGSGGVQGNGPSLTPSPSADGRWVAFFSYAANLVGGDVNGFPDAFLVDRSTGAIELLSVDSDGVQADADT